jgi:hypothetical protein
MKPQATFQVSQNVLNAIRSKSIDKTNLLLQELKHNREINSMLDGLYWPYDHKPGQVSDFVIEKGSLTFKGDNNGSFTVVFDITYYEGCKDINHTQEDEVMSIDFSIDLVNGIIHLEGEEILERDPDFY